MSSQVDNASQALDRLDNVVMLDTIDSGQALADLATVRQRLAEQDTEIQRLQDELLVKARNQNDQEKIDAWWRARSEVKVDGNSRAEYVLQRDAAWERAESAEAEVQRLTDALRDIAEDAEKAIKRGTTGGTVLWRASLERCRFIANRALLSASPSDGGGAK